jgi:hypothetical protein
MPATLKVGCPSEPRGVELTLGTVKFDFGRRSAGEPITAKMDAPGFRLQRNHEMDTAPVSGRRYIKIGQTSATIGMGMIDGEQLQALGLNRALRLKLIVRVGQKGPVSCDIAQWHSHLDVVVFTRQQADGLSGQGRNRVVDDQLAHR